MQLGGCRPPHHQPAVMSNTHTTSPGTLDQTPASTAGRICNDDDDGGEREGGREFYFSLHLFLCLSSVTAHPGWQIFLLTFCFSLLVVRLRAGVKNSQAALRLMQCVDHFSLLKQVKHGHIRCRLSPCSANLMHNSN